MNQEFARRSKSAWGEGASLKDEILDAAERLLEQTERESELSLRAVAREVGISAPSIYLHFKARKDLVDKVTERAYRQVAAQLRDARMSCADPQHSLLAMAHRYCCFVAGNRATQQLLFRLERVAPNDPLGPDHPVGLIHQEWHEAVVAALPSLDHAQSTQTAAMIWVSLHGLANLAIAIPGEADEVQVKETAAALVSQLTKI